MLLLLLGACQEWPEVRFAGQSGSASRQEDLVFGRSLWLYGRRLILGTSYETLTRLFAPPQRLSDKELLFRYDEDVRALFADSNSNGQLDGEDYLLALSVGATCKSKSAEGFGIGTHRRDIIKSLGPGMEIAAAGSPFVWGDKAVLLFWDLGVAFQFTADLVSSITIFWPGAIPPTKLTAGHDKLILGQIPLDGGPYQRSLVWLILGNADISTQKACGAYNCFVDSYYLYGLTMSGHIEGAGGGFINEITFNYPLGFSEPAWDSTTDVLGALYGENYTLLKNSNRFGSEMVLIYTFGKVHTAFCYNEERLNKISIYYETFEDDL